MMKWWGWGDYKFTFPMAEKPLLWPFIRERLGLAIETKTPPKHRSEVNLSPSNINLAFLNELKAVLTLTQISTSDDDRLHHAYGKSYPNLLEVRRGHVRQAPDMIVKPKSHAEVAAVVALAHEHNVCLIAFGGGTNIVGCVDPDANEKRMIVTMSMRLMNRVLHLDEASQTATIEAGATGPELEKQLNELGWSLGHFPDSFEYSTIGGWVATRSAGMQSDAYGKIEDMVVAVNFVTPTGVLQTRNIPASSAGPDLNQMVCGSEGVFGIITEATMRVHAMPTAKDYRGFLFRSFEDGLAATQACIKSGYAPSMIRLQDSGETELAFKMKAPKKGLVGLVHKLMKKYLLFKGYNAPCLMVIGFEGQSLKVRDVKRQALKHLKTYGAFPLGKSVGASWAKDKYNMPYLRDYVMDYGIMCDVAETSASWNNLLSLYRNTIDAIKNHFAKEQGDFGYVGCHMSHTYETGACLYFTYAAKQTPGEELQQYYRYKKLVTDSFMTTGGTLTHHHAVGYEHMPWMEQEVSATGVNALRALKNQFDPKGILNPGKLIPASEEALSKPEFTSWWKEAPNYKAGPKFPEPVYQSSSPPH